jgi:DnaJ-class molecular chaperone
VVGGLSSAGILRREDPIDGNYQESMMVCSVCNGKGYVVGKSSESICSECQGRGECFLFESDRHQKQESQEIREAR